MRPVALPRKYIGLYRTELSKLAYVTAPFMIQGYKDRMYIVFLFVNACLKAVWYTCRIIVGIA